ncbi:MAG: peptide deformylase [Endomicrobiaceae bacterium]|nr:peptide deformylase [Endomicrobiaceae bacterium]
MAKLTIVKYGDSILRNKTKPIVKITKEIKILADDMLETMYKSCGAGLAGPQVGISLKICVIDILSNGKKNPLVLINPTIIDSANKIILEEGCLSFPGIFENVQRFDTVTVEYMDLNENIKQIQGQGFLAKALQHEIDHLNGKLFIDYLQPWKRKLVEKEIKRRKKGGNW